MCIASKSLLKKKYHGNCCCLPCVSLYARIYHTAVFHSHQNSSFSYTVTGGVFVFDFLHRQNFSRQWLLFVFFSLLKLISFVMSNQFRKLFFQSYSQPKWNLNWTNMYQQYIKQKRTRIKPLTRKFQNNCSLNIQSNKWKNINRPFIILSRYFMIFSSIYLESILIFPFIYL